MNIKSSLLLNIPYKFHNVCTLYPIDVMYVISFDKDEDFLHMFIPYMLSYEIIDESLKDTPLFYVILSDQELFNNFVTTLSQLTKTDNIMFNSSTNEIFFDDNIESLNANNFDEFCDIILEMIQSERMKKQRTDEPTFKSEEGRRRWIELQKSRKEHINKAECTKIYDIINLVQFGTSCYITDSEIKQWTYWKLIKSFLTITNKRNYENSFDVYLQCGDKKLIEEHWSNLVKL